MDAAALGRAAHRGHALVAPEMRGVGRGPRRLQANVQVADAVGAGPGKSLLDRPATAEVDPDALAKRHARPLHLIPCASRARYHDAGGRRDRARGAMLSATTARSPACAGTSRRRRHHASRLPQRRLSLLARHQRVLVRHRRHARPRDRPRHARLAASLARRLRADRPPSARREAAENGAVRHRAPEPAALHLRRLRGVQRGLSRALETVGHPRGRGQPDPPHECGAGRRRAVRALALRLRLHRARHDARADLHRGRRGRDARPGAGRRRASSATGTRRRTGCARRRAS